MKSCVIGGGGFIGGYLVEQLLSLGQQVSVIGRGFKRPAHLPGGVEYISGGYGDEKILSEAIKDIDVVYDLAYGTVPKSSFEDPIFDIVNNLPASVTLLQKAALSNLKRLVIVSSGGVVYGHSEIIPIAETFPTNPISPYGITKLTIEKYAYMFSRLQNLPVTIVRPSNAYGEGQKPFTGQGFIATAMGLIAMGEDIPVFGEKGTIRDYVHVKDVASGIIAAATLGGAGEIYNISSGIGLNNLEVLQEIEKAVRPYGKSVRVKTLPERGFDVPVSILSHEKLTQHTNWHPKISFEDGVSMMWNSFANQTDLAK